MAQLVCGGCHTLLMYIRGATSVQCSCCHTINLAMEGNFTKKQQQRMQLFKIMNTDSYIIYTYIYIAANQVAHVNCGNCRMLLMYQYGARSVKCAVCSFVTPVTV